MVVVSPPTFLAMGTSLWRSLSQQSLGGVWASFILSLYIARTISDSANIYGGAETNNVFLGEIGTALLTSLGMVKFLEASISMNNKRMDESDVSASVASPADYIPYFSLALII